MKLVVSKNHDPYYNLSLEEILLKDENIKEDIILFYINHNSIIFGRNQNVHEEINEEYVNEKQINLVRRVSGGGAVYHDEGNINFSFITNKEKRSYEKFLKPIIDFLQSIGLNAEFKGKNDLSIDGIKVSGNAQYIHKDRMFHHGTLLFDSNLATLGSALKVNKLKLESKGIKSARQRVANIRTLLKEDLTTDEFKEKLFSYFKNDSEMFDISNYKQDEIQALMNVRKSHDWIYKKNPTFNVINESRYDGGTIKVSMEVINNSIKAMSFTGDFLSNNNFENIYNYFIDQEFSTQNISKIVNSIDDWEDYFGKLTKENIINLLSGIEG